MGIQVGLNQFKTYTKPCINTSKLLYVLRYSSIKLIYTLKNMMKLIQSKCSYISFTIFIRVYPIIKTV